MESKYVEDFNVNERVSNWIVERLVSVFLIFIELNRDWVHGLSLLFVLNCLVLIPKTSLTNDKCVDCYWIMCDWNFAVSTTLVLLMWGDAGGNAGHYFKSVPYIDTRTFKLLQFRFTRSSFTILFSSQEIRLKYPHSFGY